MTAAARMKRSTFSPQTGEHVIPVGIEPFRILVRSREILLSKLNPL